MKTLTRYRIMTEGGGSNYRPEEDVSGEWVLHWEAKKELAKVSRDHQREAKDSWAIREERDDCRSQLIDADERVTDLEVELREAVSVLGLLRLHRTGPDRDDPIRSSLLDREHNILAKLGGK